MNKEDGKIKKKKSLKVILSSLVAATMATALAVSTLAPTAVMAASDGVTSGHYNTELGETKSTEYAGRIWTDKSVETIKDTNDFKITYSALATGQEITGVTKSRIPLDVVFIVDRSGSMDEKDAGTQWNPMTRMKAARDAIKSTSKKLIETNADTRIGIVSFAGSARVDLALKTHKIADLNKKVDSISANGGTNIQHGVAVGMNLLQDATDVTVTVGKEQVSRVPSVILLSDGQPTYAMATETWWDPIEGNTVGTGGDYEDLHGFKTMMTAAYKKQAISEHYNVEGTNFETKVYTIGFGIKKDKTDPETQNALVTLDPLEYLEKNTIIKGWQDKYIQNGKVELTKSKWVGGFWNGHYEDVVYYTFNKPDKGTDVKDVKYNTAYYDPGNAAELNKVFDEIVSVISSSLP